MLRSVLIVRPMAAVQRTTPKQPTFACSAQLIHHPPCRPHIVHAVGRAAASLAGVVGDALSKGEGVEGGVLRGGREGGVARGWVGAVCGRESQRVRRSAGGAVEQEWGHLVGHVVDGGGGWWWVMGQLANAKG